MKHHSRFPYPVCLNPAGFVFPALVLLCILAAPGRGLCDERSGTPEETTPASWRGSAVVDSAQGTSLHLRLLHEDLALAMSMTHSTAGTPEFPGFGFEALNELSIGMNFDSPSLLVGDLGLTGLGRFLFSPAGAGPLLSVHGGKPLRAERPDAARYQGFVLGRESGLLAVQPVSDPARIASGAWFSPAGSPLSVLLLAGSDPGRIFDGWYEADRVRSERLWGAVSLGMDRRVNLHRVSLSGALAGSAGLPGPDGTAARMEAFVFLNRLRLDAEVSMVSEDWLAPDGTTAVPFRLDLSAVYRNRSLELAGAYRLEYKNFVEAQPVTGCRGQVLLKKGGKELKLAFVLGTAAGQNLPDFSLETRVKPGLFSALLPGLVLETAWKTKDGTAERFDTGVGIRGGRKLRWSLDAGLRYDTQGRHLRGSATVQAPIGRSSLRFGLKSDGWLPLAGELPDAPVALSLIWAFSSP